MKLKNIKFKWNVWIWDFNSDKLMPYDVAPIFIHELEKLSRGKRPKTKEEFDKFLKSEAQYRFWAKCEWEMVIHGWPVNKGESKVDVYGQLNLNWDAFVDAFWTHLQK